VNGGDALKAALLLLARRDGLSIGDTLRIGADD
jgi:hypothetical protein